MSGDEFFVLVFSVVFSAVVWVGRYYRGLVSERLVGAAWPLLVWLAPLAGFALIFLVLRTLAARDVRNAPEYLVMYEALGIAWMGAGLIVMTGMGLDPIADPVERRNPGAAVASAGAMIGFAFAYAGANIGDGPGWWVVVFSGWLSTGALVLVWALVNIGAGVTELVTIERDRAAAWRQGALLAAVGLVAGRGAAGNCIAGNSVPYDAAFREFLAVAWPVSIGVVLEVCFGLLFKPTQSNPSPSALAVGLPPALVYLGAAVVYVLKLGVPA
jgi:hypothetical protein